MSKSCPKCPNSCVPNFHVNRNGVPEGVNEYPPALLANGGDPVLSYIRADRSGPNPNPELCYLLRTKACATFVQEKISQNQ